MTIEVKMAEQVSENSAPRVVGSLQGSVKWFDNKLGYGYITVVTQDVPQSNNDYFVHQTNIHPLVSQYRTLVKGEYVSLNLSTEERPQALDVTGICGGALQCDLPRPPRRTGGGAGRGRGGRSGGRGRGTGSGGDDASTGEQPASA